MHMGRRSFFALLAAVPAAQIRQISPVLTMVGGRIVFESTQTLP